MAAKPERNRKMAIAVLRGYNYSQVAEVFNLSRVYVRITVLRDLCRLMGYTKPFHPYNEKTGRYYDRTYVFPLSLKEIRKNKYRLIEKLNEETANG